MKEESENDQNGQKLVVLAFILGTAGLCGDDGADQRFVQLHGLNRMSPAQLRSVLRNIENHGVVACTRGNPGT